MATSFILSLFAVPIFTKTFICTDTICDFGICTDNKCTDNTYMCSSTTTTHCDLECESCNNITLTSYARDTNIFCSKKNSCNSVSINIDSSQSTSNYNSLVLACGHSTACTNITISCNNEHNLCQCKDFNDLQCNNNVHGDFSLWHNDPFIVRKSIKDKLNHTESNQISTTDIDININISNSQTVHSTDMIDEIDMDSETSGENSWTDYAIYALFPSLFCMLLCAGTFIIMQGRMEEKQENTIEKEQKTTRTTNVATILSVLSQTPCPSTAGNDTDMITANTCGSKNQVNQSQVNTTDTSDIIYK